MGYVLSVTPTGEVLQSPRPRRRFPRRRRGSRALNPVWQWPSFLYVPVVKTKRVYFPRKPNSYVIETPSQWLRRYYKTMRGVYRVFNAAVYRFYWSLTPPKETDAPKATDSSLAFSPADTFGDGVWYLSVSYFNGCIDSGFLPIGANGETYQRLDIIGDVQVNAPPNAPNSFELVVDSGGVIRVVGLYYQTGSLRATQWAITYTTDNSDPGGAPNIGPTMDVGGRSITVRRSRRRSYVVSATGSELIQSAGGRISLPTTKRGSYAVNPAWSDPSLSPPVGGPTVTVVMPTKGAAVLNYSIPSQADGTIVRVRLQTRRLDGATWRYSEEPLPLGETAAATAVDGAGRVTPTIIGSGTLPGRAPKEF